MSSLSPAQADLLLKWLPSVKGWAARQRKIPDIDAAESAAVAALDRAVRNWHGAGSFEGYLKSSISNAWKNHMRDTKRRNGRFVSYSTADGEGDGGIDADSCAALARDTVPGQEPGHFRQRPRGMRRRYRGGDSVVVMAVLENEAARAFREGGLLKAMHVLGFSEEEIRDAVQRERRRGQQRDRRRANKGADDFGSLFI